MPIHAASEQGLLSIHASLFNLCALLRDLALLYSFQTYYFSLPPCNARLLRPWVVPPLSCAQVVLAGNEKATMYRD
jgi:hypothetical protein